MVVTIDSIMKPVLGAPVGIGVASTGGIATHTPAEKIFGYFGLRWCRSTITKPRGLHRPSTAATASTPLNAGSSMAKANGSCCGSSGWPFSSCGTTVISPSRTSATLLLTIHLMWRWRISDSIRPLESPTPPSPMWPMYGSLVTKVIGTLSRSLRLRRSASTIIANS